MQYDPLKRKLGKVFNKTPGFRRLFYRLLDLLLLRAWYVKREIKAFLKDHKQPVKILDAGSGFGQYVYFMFRRFPAGEIEGLDVKKEQVKDCTLFFNRIDPDKRVHFSVQDLTHFVRPETYDFILCVDVMEHIKEDEKVLSNYFRSLKPGGLLLISTPSDQGGSDVHDNEEESFIEEHVRDGYNSKDIREKLERSGFSRVEVYYSYGKPGQIAWKLSMKIPIVVLNVSTLFFILLPFYYMVTWPVVYVLNWLDVHNYHKTGTGLIVKAWK
ncbi:MAG TPA: class I SAM-dependent methyltransferase [Bacteroidetes bacterium]|nr:class I SAM-dependent methyltransferase [Bacteroidota bacterium]